MIPQERGEEEEEDIQGPHHLAVKYVTASFLSSAQNLASVDRKKTSLYSRLVVESPESLTLNLWTIDSGCPSKLQCVSKSLHLTHLAVKNKRRRLMSLKTSVGEIISQLWIKTLKSLTQNSFFTDPKTKSCFLLKNVKKKQPSSSWCFHKLLHSKPTALYSSPH
jgi:hypothetical protein